MELRIHLPDAVKRIIRILEAAGYEAYAVGGCVRDSLLGRAPEDWDITTSASPAQVKGLFSRTVDTGIEHGTVTVLVDHVGYEVTTYRVDGEYEDHRHPKEVTFTTSLYEDLRRRDFTINAMAYSERDGLVDLFSGAEDLERGVIRCVGDANERFEEDALRIFRGARFAAQLGFAVEEQTKEAMKRKAGNLATVSAERIRVELVKLLLGAYPDRILLAYETGITAVVLPEWDRMMEQSQANPHHSYNVGMHTFRAIEALHGLAGYEECSKKEKIILNMTMLLHDVAKPLCVRTDDEGVEHFDGHQEKSAELAREVLRRLKFDNDTVKLVGTLILHHDSRHRMGKESRRAHKVRIITGKVGRENMKLLLLVQEADVLAHSPETIPANMEVLNSMKEHFAVTMRENQCVCLAELAIRGSDLIAMGYPAGPVIGDVLQALLEEVLAVPEHNEAEWLRKTAEHWQQDFRERS